METKIEERIKLLEDLYVSLLDTIKSIDRHTGISISKLEERIKSLEERVLQQSNSNTQNLIKIVKLDEYNEELLERIKSLEGGCKCKANNNSELDKLRKENKKLKQTVKDLRLQIRLGNLYDKYERGEIDIEQYNKYIEFLKYL
jgi:TolA-binding protein